MPEPSVGFAGNLTDNPEPRHTEGGITRAMFRVAVSGRREQEAEGGSARSAVEVVAEELGPNLRWATATTTRTTRSQDQ
jgi:hypothetical protein